MLTQQIKNSSIEAWMLQCLEMNGNCLIGNKRIRNHGIEKIEKDFQIWGKPVYIEAILNGGIIDSAPFIRAGNKKAINRDLSFIAYLKKEKHI